jgi:DNA-binding NarL/FixJ family response regulator
MEKEITILIADDHYLIAKLIKMMLIGYNDKFKVNIVGSSNEVFEYIIANNLDILLLDIDMPDIDGIQVLKKIKISNPEVKILMVSNHTETWVIKRALKFGANGYVSKFADSEEIIKGINAILSNEIFLCKTALKCLYCNENNSNNHQDLEHTKNKIGCLSKREFEILKLVVEEYSSKEISELLFISSRTVETHRKNILNKLGVKNSLGLIRLFVESNLFDSIEVS